MKPLTFVIALLATSFLAVATESEQAPKEMYDRVVTTCQEWAKEDGTPAGELKEYLTTCIKNELENLGYAPVVKELKLPAQADKKES